MENLVGRYRNITILGAVVILQILGLAIQIKRQEQDKTDSTRLIRIWTVGAVSPFEKVFVRVQTGASGVWHNYFYLRGVRQQNRDLQQQIEQMQIADTRLRQDAEQAHRLQVLLNFKEQYINKTVAAQVIGTSGSEQSRLVTIDKGSDDGIKAEMAVITPNGIVGKVLRADSSTAQVLLINDQNSGVGTILEQSRLQGVLKGKPSGEVVLDKIMSDEEVKQGDRVLTSGGDQIFPKGLSVGTVARIIRGTEFLQVVVQPSASLNHLEEVLVITRKEEHEPASLAENPVRAADILAERLPSVPDPQPQSGAAAKGAAGTTTSSTATAKPAEPKQTGALNGVRTTPSPAPHRIQAESTTGAPGSSSGVATAKPVAAETGQPDGASGSVSAPTAPKPPPQKPAGAAAQPSENPGSTKPDSGAPPQ